MIQVKIVHLDREDNETIMEVETFIDAKKYTDRKVQKWVNKKAQEYNNKYHLSDRYTNGEDEKYFYYEFQYYKLDKRPYHLTEWFNIQNESVLDTYMNL